MKNFCHLIILIILFEFFKFTSPCVKSKLCKCMDNSGSKVEIFCEIERNKDITFHLEKSKKLRIQCDLNGAKIELDWLPKLENNSKLDMIEFQYCPQPKRSFHNILFSLNVSDFKELWFHTIHDDSPITFHKTMFDNMKQLENLLLDSNKIKYIPKDLFEYLNNLKYLDLNKNELESLEPGTFEHVPNLITLKLWNNKLRMLKSNIFYPLKKLESLILSKNKLIILEKDLFKECTNLNTLELGNNPLEPLQVDLFKFNKKLKKLYLQDTELIHISQDIFKYNNNLDTLVMDRNVHLNHSYLKGITNLTELSLRFCQLKFLESNFFQNTKKLERLDLRNNLINLTIGNFDGLINLKHLILSNNKIKMIPDDLFRDMHELKTLNLNNNNLESIQGSLFNGLLKLEELHLKNNRIKSVSYKWSTLKHLKKLDIQYNIINELNLNIFYDCNKNLEINLRSNNISKIHLLRQINVGELNSYINLDDNPLSCNCELYDFIQYVKETDPYSSKLKGNFVCNQPESLKGVSIMDVSSTYLLNCTKTQCLNSCDCYETNQGESYVDCAFKNLTDLPKLSLQGDVFHVELNLTGNNLKTFNVNGKGYEIVTKLYLDYNEIKEINEIPLNLTVLTVSNNAIHRLSSEIIDQLNHSINLQYLNFANNPWKCDCTTSKFSNFLREQAEKLLDKNITCENNKELLMIDLNSKNFCVNETHVYLISGILSLTLLIIILCMVVLYYQYTEEIKIWLFSNNLLLWFVTEEEIDKDKEFDAFVSFAHQDQEFVENELLPVLENGPEQYKLCLHYRNWIGGEYILTQIIKSVEDSRRTIIVLSENFLKSLWGKMEFRMAHQKALRERCARVIIIIYGDVNPNEIIDDELKSYLKTNTYIEWGDAWFWNKLKYALPHSHKKRKIDDKRINRVFANIDKLDLIPTTAIPLLLKEKSGDLVEMRNSETT